MKDLKIGAALFVLIGIAIIGSVIAMKPRPEVLSPTPLPIACTDEAKLCSDGSYVGRTGPQCRFSACPTIIGATNTPPVSTITGGITGTVLLGPTCPVMREPPDPQCADKPYSTSLEVATLDGTGVVARFNSDAQGKFKVSVPPGEYAVRSAATTNFYPRCSGNGNIIVKSNTFTDTAISCDTGIR